MVGSIWLSGITVALISSAQVKSLWSAPCRGWRGQADRAGSRYVCGGGGRLPGRWPLSLQPDRELGLKSLQCWRLWWMRYSGEIMMGEGLELQNYPRNVHTGAGLKALARG